MKKAGIILLAYLTMAVPLSNSLEEKYPKHLANAARSTRPATIENRLERALNNFDTKVDYMPYAVRLNDALARFSAIKDQKSPEKAQLENELLLMMKYTHPIEIQRHNILNWKEHLMKKTSVYSSDLLYDVELWKDLFWNDWKAVPSDLLAASLKNQFSKFDSAFDQDRWPEMTNKDWNEVPGPVKTAAFMIMIKQATENSGIEKVITDGTAYKWYCSVIITESFFEHNLSKSDIGLSQLSPYAMEHLARTNKFYGFSKEKFSRPYYSIMGGEAWFMQCLKEAKYNLRTAVRAYNAGIGMASRGSRRAKEYEKMVNDRFERYMDQAQAHSPVWRNISNFVDKTNTESIK